MLPGFGSIPPSLSLPLSLSRLRNSSTSQQKTLPFRNRRSIPAEDRWLKLLYRGMCKKHAQVSTLERELDELEGPRGAADADVAPGGSGLRTPLGGGGGAAAMSTPQTAPATPQGTEVSAGWVHGRVTR